MRWAVALLLLSGCLVIDAKRNARDIDALATWSGTIAAPPEGKQAFAVVLRQNEGTWQLQTSRLFYTASSFQFQFPPGAVRLFAFTDLNGDQAWQPNEPSAEAAPHAFGDGDTYDDERKLTMAAAGPKPPVEIALELKGVSEEGVEIHRGDVFKFDDERVSIEAGKLGFWQPVDYAKKYGFGISFLEPYDPKKIPVIFVHGAQGAPLHFKPVVERLDHDRYQAWFYTYPTGMRLESSASSLRRIVDEMQLKLGFERVVVVGYSMGGLVARSFVSQVAARSHHRYVKLLVTISTPFGGDLLAQTGLVLSPLLLPCWVDMATGSPFLTAVAQPMSVPHHVFFGYAGGKGGNDPTDGMVNIRSMLLEPIQDGAALVRGFPDDHMKIMEDPELAAALERSLKSVEVNTARSTTR